MARPARGAIRIGCSGWIYPHWRERFYPKELPQKEWFRHYTSVFDRVEINNSFYHLPSEKAVAQWEQQAPSGFVYAVKVNRFITHMKKLKEHMARIEVPRVAIGPVAYVRFHGTLPRYAGGYSERTLRSWAQWLTEQAAAGRSAFAYFNNDVGAQAIFDAQKLRPHLSQLG